MEKVRKQYADIKKLYTQGLTIAPINVKQVLDLYDTIKTLQQENEQLRAQVTKTKEALTIANNYMPDIGQFCACGKCKTCGADINYVGHVYCVKCARAIIDEALSDTSKNKERKKF